MSNHHHRHAALTLIIATGVLGNLSGAAESPANEQEPALPAIFSGAAPVMSCEELLRVSAPDTTIDSAGLAASDGSCRVTATVIHPPDDNPIKVYLALPTKAWNGRFTGTGGGGYAGGSTKSLNLPVTQGYAVGATDTGNEKGTAGFALDTHGKPAWQHMRDNAYVGIHDMTVVGKALTQAFYGKAPRYSYFVGGSTGGRQALTEAQRYPNDYDGILALYPAIARDRYVPAQLWPQILMREANDFLPREKREAATAAAVKACDAADGVVDGVIDDPTRCEYDPAALVGTKIGDSMFTATDARIIRGIWDGPKAHDGSFLWWGPTRGTDLSILADTGGTPIMGKPCWEGLDWFRYFLVLDPKWDWTTLTHGEFELLFEQSIEEHASIYGGDDPNLTDFRDRGGKLLIVHGLADQIVPPQESIAYYKNVQRRMTGPQRTDEFVRLFLVPGGDHGFASRVPTPSPGEMMDAVVQWVEHGHAPVRLNAKLMGDHGKLIRTRPLFPYPQVAKYTGSGSTDEAANFVSFTRENHYLHRRGRPHRSTGSGH
jgi:pimeloyl-ACP methyl ester carboxylesterase